MNFIKKEIKIAIIIAIMLIFLPIYSHAVSKGTIVADTVRLREEPSTDSSVVTLLSQDDEVEIIEKENNWYKVKYKEDTGYISSEFVKTEGTNVEEDTDEIIDENIDENMNVDEKTTEENIVINTTKKISKVSNIYFLPLINSGVMGVAEKSQDAYIIQTANKWAFVLINNMNGWIRIENLVDEVENTNQNPEEEQKPQAVNEENEEENKEENNTPVAEQYTKKIKYINAENVNFRKSADKTSEIIDTLSLNTEVELIEQEDDWYKIKVNNQTGYVSIEFISNEKTTSSRSQEIPRETTLTSNVEVNNNIQEQIVEYAKTFLGYPYVYGGSTPSGFDCSGFVQYVYKHFGYSVSRSSVSQAKDGQEVSLQNLQLGDILIFKAYDDYSRIGHVGLYIGDNQFIHANDEKTGVIITSLSKGKYPERFVCGRRIV